MVNKKAKEKTKKEIETEELRGTILDKALNMFASEGFQSTSMQDIADGVGVSRGPLYYYFKDKNDLFDSTFDRSINQIETIVTEIFSSQDTFFDKIEEELYAFFNQDYRDGERLREYVRNNPDQHQKCYEQLKSSRKVIQFIKLHSAKQAIQQGELKEDTNVNQMIELVFIFHRGILSERVFWEESDAEQKVRETITELIALLQCRYGA